MGDQTTSIASIPDTTAEDAVIEETLKKIDTSCRIIGDQTTKRIVERDSLIGESIEATHRFRALQRRVDEFIRLSVKRSRLPEFQTNN